MIMRLLSGFLFYLFFSIGVTAQELPPLKNFTTEEYLAGHQNWDITEDDQRSMYFANNKGLLVYNGARWALHASENQTIIRSVAYANNKVYSGTYMDFGYWEKDNAGRYQYTSLVAELDVNVQDDEEFWTIIPIEAWVVFQSFDTIFIYNTQTSEVARIASEHRISKMFKSGDHIYFQRQHQGLFKIANGKAILVSDHASVKNDDIINVYQQDDGLLIHIRDNGFLAFKDATIAPWNIRAQPLLLSVSAYSSSRLRNGNFCIGTISHGVIILNSKGEVLYGINQQKGLANNTVLSTFEDSFGNIWLGLDDGLSVINSNSPYSVFNDSDGQLGTIYTAEKSSKFLYLGTNQGLFYKPLETNDDFSLIPNTQGQVWQLKYIDEQLFCGHDKGSYLITDTTAKKIASEKGAWDFKKIEDKPNMLLQGSYEGLSILEKESSGSWVFKHKIKGFDMSSRYFEFINATQLLVNHEYKGVYRLVFDDNFKNVLSFSKDTISTYIRSSLVKFNDSIVYMNNKGVYNYKTDGFRKTTLLKPFLTPQNYVSGKLVKDKFHQRLWSFFKNQLVVLSHGNLTQEFTYQEIDLSNTLRHTKSGFENSLHLKDERYLLGTTDGYIILDLDHYEACNSDVFLDHIRVKTNTDKALDVPKGNKGDFKTKQNTITFRFSSPYYSALRKTLYRYRLKGASDTWSNWMEQTEVVFENLPHNTYTFEVQSKTGNTLSNNIAAYSFSIAKPWYKTHLAIVLYIVLFSLLLFSIQYVNLKFYQKQKKRLLAEQNREMELRDSENKRQLSELKNKNLKEDIAHKNRELDLSTMNLIRQNELLHKLKKQLTSTKQLHELDAVIHNIDQHLSNSEDWDNFEKVFTNSDKDFLKTIKQKHPRLTSNDLKLCTYLRLNLSSKEIAPLLNISPRSVEVKRYRLRKKMNLPHESSLSEYILSI